MDVNAGIPDSNQPTYGEGTMVKGKNKGRPIGKALYAVVLEPFQQRFSALKTEAVSKWYPIWKDIARYILPKRGFFEGMMPNWGTRIDHKTVMSGDPMNHVRTLASGMQSGLTSPAKPWFRLEVDDADAMEQEDAKEWLELATKKVLRAFQASNVYGAFYSMYEEVSTFGTSCFLLLENAVSVVRARFFTAGEYFLGAGADGVVNAFAREFWMTAAQLVEEFGYENCSTQVQNEFDANTVDTWHKVRHLIEPNDERIPGLKDAQNMPFRSAHWEANSEGNNKALRVSGFEEFPVIATRWDLTTTADVYGSAPGWNILGDVKTLFKMVKKYLEALDKVVDPPMVADSGVVVNTLPGGLTRASSQSPNGGVKPAYQINPNLAEMRTAIADLARKIGDGLLANFFLMIAQTGKDMTAEEVSERQAEKVLMLGPVLHRLESEALGPTIERTFNILVRSGALPPPPRSIAGRPIKVRYISFLAQAQEMAETAVIEQFTRFVGGLAGARPDVLDNISFDEMVREYGRVVGLPAKILNAPEIMAKLRAARAKQQATAEGAQNAQAAAATAKVLADTKLGGGTALAGILGGAPGQAPAGGVA